MEKTQLLECSYKHKFTAAKRNVLHALQDEMMSRLQYDARQIVGNVGQRVGVVADAGAGAANVNDGQAFRIALEGNLPDYLVDDNDFLGAGDEASVITDSDIQLSRDLLNFYDANQNDVEEILHEVSVFRREVLFAEANREQMNMEEVVRQRTIEELFDDIQGDILDNISDVAMYPRYGTHGFAGEVHFNRIWLEVNFQGPDCNADTFDDIPGVDAVNTLVTQEYRNQSNKCIHGGQIYNPGNVNANFSRANDYLKKNLDSLTIWLSDYLSNIHPGNVNDAIPNGSERLKKLVTMVSDLSEQWVGKEAHRDNARLRIELTMVHSERTNLDLDRLLLSWPVRLEALTHFSDISHSLMLVQQSKLYESVVSFVSENVNPLRKLLLQDELSVCHYSAATKTRLLWCAECIIKATANSFYVGKIHNTVKCVSHLGGKFEFPDALKAGTIPLRDKIDLEITWGIEPSVMPTVQKQYTTSDNQIRKALEMKCAIKNHCGRVDFPDIYVQALTKLWLTSQQFSFNKTKRDDIGYFMEPDWVALATMNGTKGDKYLQVMFKAVIDSYRKNWFLILKQTSRNWDNRAVTGNFASCPIIWNDINTRFAGALFMSNTYTNENGRNSGLSANDKTSVTTIGKFFDSSILLRSCKFIFTQS
jgi:hypothetical protein